MLEVLNIIFHVTLITQPFIVNTEVNVKTCMKSKNALNLIHISIEITGFREVTLMIGLYN